MGTTPPVVAESIITPPAGGSLIVQVVDASGDPVSNMTVTGSGAGTLSGTTGPDGCVIFGGLNPGSYNVSVSQSGYVDKDGNTTPPVNQQAVTVIPGSSATKTFYFDQAGAMQVYFSSKQYGGATNTNVTGDTLVVFNNNMTYPGYRYFGAAGTPDTPPLVAPNIFPFPSTYTVYAGSCAADAPSAFGGHRPDDAPSTPARPSRSAAPVRARRQPPINLPALNLVVHSGTGTSSPGSVLERRPRRHHRHGVHPERQAHLLDRLLGSPHQPVAPVRDLHGLCRRADLLDAAVHEPAPASRTRTWPGRRSTCICEHHAGHRSDLGDGHMSLGRYGHAAETARTRAGDERGFTLVELLVSLSAGVVLMLALFAVFDIAVVQSARSIDRVESSQRGRTAMEQLIQELHSSCVAASVAPVLSTSDSTTLKFVSQFGSAPVLTPNQHVVTVQPDGDQAVQRSRRQGVPGHRRQLRRTGRSRRRRRPPRRSPRT